MLNNIMIINPPKERQSEEEFYGRVDARTNLNPLDFDFLDEDLLAEDFFDESEFEFTELDIDYLDVDLLEDVLDTFDPIDEDLLQEEKQQTGGVDIQGTEEGFDPVTQVVAVVDGEKVKVIREVADKVEVTVDQTASTLISIEQDQRLLDPIMINGTGTTITVVQ